MERRTKFTDEELDRTSIINVIEFDLLTRNGIIYADIDHFHSWNAWQDPTPRFLPRFIKVYSIYPDMDLYTFFNSIIPKSYYLWDVSEYHYIKNE